MVVSDNISKYNNSSTDLYLALGDSLAVGLGALLNGEGYTRLYYKWLYYSKNYNQLRYRNLGIIGLTSQGLLYSIQSKAAFLQYIQAASIITLDIGGNDIIKAKYSVELLNQALINFKENLCSTLYIIRNFNKEAKLYLADIYNPYPKGHMLNDIGEHWVKSFNEVIWDLSSMKELNISGVADIYDAFKNNELQYTNIAYGNIHPNYMGYIVIADCFKKISESNELMSNK